MIMAEESPTLDQPTEVVVEEKPEDLDAFAQTLKEFGIKDNTELEGKLNASQQSGQLANLLGEERKRTQALEEKIEGLQAKPNKELDLDNYGEGQTVDLESLITNVYRKERKRDMAMAQKQQQYQMQQYGKIVNNKNYKGPVKELWEQKQQDPSFMVQVQNGQIDPVEAFHGIVDEYKTNLLVKAGETITTLQTGKAPPIPHVEGSERTPTNLVSEDPDKKSESAQVIKEMQDITDKGGQLVDVQKDLVIDSIFRD